MALSLYAFALIMSINSGFKEAPPTRKPSTSFWEASSLQVPPVTDPETVDNKKGDILTMDSYTYIEQHTSNIYIIDVFGSAAAWRTSLNLLESQANSFPRVLTQAASPVVYSNKLHWYHGGMCVLWRHSTTQVRNLICITKLWQVTKSPPMMCPLKVIGDVDWTISSWNSIFYYLSSRFPLKGNPFIIVKYRKPCIRTVTDGFIIHIHKLSSKNYHKWCALKNEWNNIKLSCIVIPLHVGTYSGTKRCASHDHYICMGIKPWVKA